MPQLETLQFGKSVSLQADGDSDQHSRIGKFVDKLRIAKTNSQGCLNFSTDVITFQKTVIENSMGFAYSENRKIMKQILNKIIL